MIGLARDGQQAAEIAAAIALNPATSGHGSSGSTPWGSSGLNDPERSGRPTTFTPRQVALVAASLTDPQSLSRGRRDHDRPSQLDPADGHSLAIIHLQA
jgi:hypothetical protein